MVPETEKFTFHVQVSKASLDRAFDILNRIVHAAVELHIKLVEPSESNQRFAAFEADGERVSLFMREKILRELIQPTDGKVHYFKEYNFTFTGKLEFSLDTPYGCSLRRTWSDGKIQRLEDFPESIARSILEIGAAWKRRRLELEEQRRQWEEEARIRKEKERQFAFRKMQRQRLDQQANSWAHSQLLLRYIGAAEQVEPTSSEVAEWWAWIDWMKAEARRLDPLEEDCKPWMRWAKENAENLESGRA
jgi:hypothetical protein